MSPVEALEIAVSMSLAEQEAAIKVFAHAPFVCPTKVTSKIMARKPHKIWNIATVDINLLIEEQQIVMVCPPFKNAN